MIIEQNNLSNKDGDTSVIFTRIDTNTFRLKIECGKFIIGEDEYAEEGEYQIIDDEIQFISDINPCPDFTECINLIQNSRYKWSCQEDVVELTSFQEDTFHHAVGSIFGAYTAIQYFSEIIY